MSSKYRCMDIPCLCRAGTVPRQKGSLRSGHQSVSAALFGVHITGFFLAASNPGNVVFDNLTLRSCTCRRRCSPALMCGSGQPKFSIRFNIHHHMACLSPSIHLCEYNWVILTLSYTNPCRLESTNSSALCYTSK